MRIQHNIAALNGYRNYNNNASTVNKNLEKLSSGYRINRAGDDAAGLAISEKMRKEITGLKVYQKNAKDGIGMIQTAEGALTEIHSMLNRMYELEQLNGNSLYDGNDKKALEEEYKQLRKEINRIGKTASYNNMNLLDGTMKSATITIAATSGSCLTLTLTFDKKSAVNGTNLGIGATSKGISGGAEGAITKISKLRAKLGAYQNRLEHTVANLSVMHENMVSAESSIRDTDVAEEMMAYTKNNIMIQAAQAMLAQANQQPQGVLQLLQ